jgi:hypothetical protein
LQAVERSQAVSLGQTAPIDVLGDREAYHSGPAPLEGGARRAQAPGLERALSAPASEGATWPG